MSYDDDFDDDDFDDDDDDDDFDDDDDDFDDDDDDDVICECNNCNKLFRWEPVLVRYKGVIGVFCSDSCAKEALYNLKEGEKENRDALISLGLDVFKWLSS